MRSTLTNKFVSKSLLALSLISLTQCTSTSSGPEPEWAAKNKELIAEHKLTVREISGLPKKLNRVQS